jgi:hypothetical protein
LRSKAGLLAYLEAGYLTADNATAALRQSTNPVAQTLLIPFAPDSPSADLPLSIEPVILARLRTTAPASAMHVALVEVVRRRYIQYRKEADRRDKETIRARTPWVAE